MEKEKGVVEKRMLEDKKGVKERTVGGWGGGRERGRNPGLELMPEDKNDGEEEGSGKMKKTRVDGRKTGGCINERRLGEEGVTCREG